MPQGMSREREALLRLYGAEAIMTESMGGMHEAVDEAMRLARETPNSFVPQQFKNPANPEMHRRTTAEEIWSDLDGDVDVFVAARRHGRHDHGRGGGPEGAQARRARGGGRARELAGAVGRASRGRTGSRGSAPGFVPTILNRDVIDEIIPVTDDDAIETARALAAPRGGLRRDLGGRGDLGRAAGRRGARSRSGKRIVTVIPDAGERYISTPFFAP